MQFGQTIKKKMRSSSPSHQSMDFVTKWGTQFINFITNFFICLKMLIMKH